MINKSLLNFVLRAINPVVKFLFLTIIGKKFGSSFLGEYSLFSTTVNLAVYFVGLDFYNFCIREFVKSDTFQEKNKILSNQFFVYLVSYLFFFIISLFLFNFNILERSFMFYFLGIVIFDHISQELFRIFNANREPIIASLIFLIRSGLWVIIIFILFFLGVNIALNTIFLFWFMLSVASSVIGSILLIRRYRLKFKYVEFKFIKRGVMVTVIFFFTTITSKILEFSNRYIIDFFMTKSEVGVFSFFSSISNQLVMIVDSIVIVNMLPVLVKKIGAKDKVSKDYYYLFNRNVFFVAVVGALVLVVVSYPFVRLIGRFEFIDYYYVLVLILIGQVIYILSFVPHYLMFALNNDLGIMKATCLASILGIVCNVFLIKNWGLFGAAIGYIGSSLFLLFFRKFYSLTKIKIWKAE